MPIVFRLSVSGMRAAMLATAVLLFAACTARAEMLIAVIGDSNVNGRGVSRDQAYPAKLERALRAKGRDVRVLNSGVNGDTTAGVSGRLDSAAPPGTKVAVLWFGVNDINRGMPRDQVRANVREIAGRLKSRGIEVVIIWTGDHVDLFQKYSIESETPRHLTPAGYDVLVGRTLAQINQAVARAQK